MELSNLIQAVTSYTDAPEAESVLTVAYQIASETHAGYKRISGEPFLNHPLAVAAILAGWHAPPHVIAVGLLHDIKSPDYSRGYDLEAVKAVLGLDIFRLLDVVIDLNSYIRYVEGGDYHSEADAKDFRYHMASYLRKERDAVVIKFADRLHNLQTITALTRAYQKRATSVGLNLLVPLADRLGMGTARRQLEALCFENNSPIFYEELRQNCTDANLGRSIEGVLEELQRVISSIMPHCKIRWQPASLYEIGQDVQSGKSIRTEPYSLKLVNIGSFVILTDDESDCYRILGIIHKYYQPVEGRFHDFIGRYQENGYQSLHTQVMHTSGNVIQVVIRTSIMDLIVEYGITAGWWHVAEECLPQLPEDVQPVNGEIQVFTPKGETKYLPRGATVLDFAYHIHTDVGNHCKSASVNGVHAELYRTLHTGDRIEIISGDPSSGPTLDWLDYVQTPHAISCIRQHLTQHRRDAMIEHGRMLLERDLQPVGLDLTDARVQQSLIRMAVKEGLESKEDLLVSIGVGHHTTSRLVNNLKTIRLKSVRSPNYVEPIVDVNVLSPEEAKLPRTFARCCGPVPPDDIVGYRRNDDILAIHKRTCSQITESTKFIQVKWDTTSTEPDYVMVVEALNRPGLASDVSTVLALLGIDMQSFSAHKRPGGIMAEVHINLGKTTLAQRNRIQKALESTSYVTNVEVIHSSFLSASISLPVSTRQPYEPNPYGPTLAEGSRFYGRETECERISNLLCNRSHNTAILLCGQKRIGKTSLVLRLQEHAQRDFYPVYIDVQGLRDSSTTQFLHQLMSSIFNVLQEKLPEVVQGISVPSLHNLRKDPLSYYDTFLARIQEVAKSYLLVVILDEFQCICSLREEGVSRSAIFSRLRSHSLHGKGFHFILSAGGLPYQLSDQSDLTSLVSITHEMKLGCLEEQAARRLIKDGLTRVGSISDLAIDHLLNLTAGHPFYLQLLCSRLYDEARENRIRITQHYVSQNIHEWIIQTSKNRFQHLWEGYDATSAVRNKLILSAIAQLSTSIYGVEYERLARAICPTIAEQEVVCSLDYLTDLGVIKRDHSSYAIEVDLFVRWLRHHWPLELALQEARWI